MSSIDIVARLRAAGCVFAEEEAALLEAAADGPELERLVARRVAGEPLEPLIGWVRFCGLRVTVTPGVFVPRQRTELLVREASALARPGDVVLDLCCGCGAIGAAIAHAVDGVELHAADVDPVAVACARTNLPHGRVYTGDLFDALPATLRGRIAVVAANVPYVPSDAIALMPTEARDHEPRATLDGGPDGLGVLRRVAGRASEWLAPGGHLLIEIGERQRTAAVAAFEAGGLAAWIVHDSDTGGTVVVGRLSAARPAGR